jgi:hypothetical protein
MNIKNKISLLIFLIFLCIFTFAENNKISFPKNDTIPVIIIYIDTTSTPIINLSSVLVNDNKVYWKKGFLVFDYQKVDHFLWEDKERISKNIIILKYLHNELGD